MKKFVLFLVLPVLLIGCATTSTEQVGQTSQEGKVPSTPQQLSEQPGSKEPKVSSGLEVQKILEGKMAYSRPEDEMSSGIEAHKPSSMGGEELKLAEPTPEAAAPRRPWGGMFHVPAGVKPPKTSTEEITASKKAPESLPETIDDDTQPLAESLPSPELADRVGTSPSSKSKKRPWGGMWYAPIRQPPQTIEEETAPQNIETPPPASWDEYEEVDFGKFASGSYVSDYANKYVKVKCMFSSIGSEFIEIPQYPRPEYVTFVVTGIESQLRSLRVVMPKLQADAVFKLKPQREIVLYGKAVQVDLHTLSMEVLKIER